MALWLYSSACSASRFNPEKHHEDYSLFAIIDHVAASTGAASGESGTDEAAAGQAGRHGQAEGEELQGGRLQETAVHGRAGEEEGVQEQAVREAGQDGRGDEARRRRHQGAEQAAD